ncbi:hypothetical protein P3X46_030165 [Hevea brasiliensis]|uniref:Uncharacterized protein n=1 Tax=Hevea brasiliensis TaxID=3981 RepID=A0ABQ9KUX7_HEVBR|nr:uncharacterized protein LOC110637066 [Hevea brasiliensis]KAJ9148070.1 hypothetical protein P3X46_030165 [Hevea brasiliensis]
MGGAQALKRIPRIKFPQRHLKSSGSASHSQEASTTGNADLTFFSSSKTSTTVGGKASLQPKRTPLSNDEIEAILLGGCI